MSSDEAFAQRRADAAVLTIAPAEEQAWNGAALDGGLELPAVRVFRYDRPAVVLGRAQRPDDTLRARAQRLGVELCERQSGGGAVLVGPWLLGVSVVLPAGHPLIVPSIPASYRWLGEAHRALLAAAGVAADLATARTDAADLAWACFAGLSHGELTVHGRKIVGLAQARRRPGVLFSAGILVADTPWEVLVEVMGKPPSSAPALAERTISGAELGVRLSPDDLLAELAARLATP